MTLLRWLLVLGCALAALAWVPGPSPRSSSLRQHHLPYHQPRPQGTAATNAFLVHERRRRGCLTTVVASSSSSESPSAGGGAPAASYDVDVAIIGGGPAGSVMAALLAQQHKLKVVLVDPKLDKRWIPNYGVWLAEWQGTCVWCASIHPSIHPSILLRDPLPCMCTHPLAHPPIHARPSPALEKLLGFSLEKCLMKVWPNTDLFCGGSHGIPDDERLRVKRPYGRVDRVVR